MGVLSPHAPAVCVPSAPSLRGAAAPFLALSPWTTRILVSLCVRLGTACARCEPTSRAPFSIIFFGVVQSGIHESLPTAILAAFSHTPSFLVHGVVPATRLSPGTRSHNRRCQTALQSQFEEVRPASHTCARAHATRSLQQHHIACDVRDTRCRARMSCVRFGAFLVILRAHTTFAFQALKLSKFKRA
ncbi:hypothetical protein B0H14DRAFT_1030042 [Mycena olivaceomarginata]|nr:hypothetical protein B0H14DRAFT_1030042 [Mycena olivaceomarginata]